MEAILAILFSLFGVYAALGICVPRLRAHWSGTRIKCGPLSCAGLALFFLIGGARFFIGKSPPERYRLWFFFALMTSWILGVLGYFLDARAHSRNSSLVSSTPAKPLIDLRANDQDWIFIILVFPFFLMAILTLLFHK